ncbi:LysE family translocator [Fulvimarina sp. 2208YS6-2-32]|uniref:LysE family translocator n=1 Tax=Fulvimarina uroteuthidis TaxID=3098149 RepID=A0ABU5I1S2_9HYPH|nr:LysE family translocator [Fulvimarina sp. 2208YS6-2-32]MDY8108111.1 LysE family translocator [Fulvimarina sp. 2208YS6-2-32]
MPVDPSTYLAFVAASMLLLAIPGPTVIMVVGQSLAHGRPAALASVVGVGLGDLCLAILSLAGVGALLAASAGAFTLMKWIGALYLVYLGIRLWRAPVTPIGETGMHGTSETVPKMKILREAFLVTLFNPKGIVFFVAFVPQFVDWSAAYWPQAIIFVATFTTLAMANGFVFALAASRARRLATRPFMLRALQRAGGACLAGAGLLALAARRPI